MEINNYYENYQAHQTFEEHLADIIYDTGDPHEFLELLTTNAELTRNQPVSSYFVKCLVSDVVLSYNEEIVEAFLNFFEPEARNDPQKQLIVAIFKGDIEEAELLLKNGVSLVAGDWKDQILPAIYSSVLFRHTYKTQNMLTLLIKHGLDTTIKNRLNQNLIHAVSEIYEDSGHYDPLELSEVLFNSGVAIDEVDSKGFSPLHYAIMMGQDSDLVKFYIEKGADVNGKSNDGINIPLILSVRYNFHEEITQMLVSSGADVNAKDSSNGRTTLHEACDYSSKTIIELLLRKGADVTSKDKGGKTPFSLLRPESSNYHDCLFIMTKELTKKFYLNVYVHFAESIKDTPAHSLINSLNHSLMIFAKDLSLILKNTKSREYFGKCKSEIMKMKSLKFYPPYSYFDILNNSKKIKKLSKLTRNVEFITKFNENLDSCPYYKEDLIKNFDEVVQVRNDSTMVSSRLNSIFKGILPDLVISIVAESLTAIDLPEQ